MTRVVFSAGYILLIEADVCHSSDTREKLYIPVAFGSSLFSPNQLNFSIYVKESFNVYFAFEAFGHYVWGVTDKPILVLPDNKNVTRVFQAKQLLDGLWNALAYVQAFKFQLGHFPGKWPCQLSLPNLC